MTPNMQATFEWLKEQGFMTTTGFSDEQKDAMARAFDSGNYSNTYVTTDLDSLASDLEEMSECQRAAFVLGFFGTYTLDEIGSDREIFDECYFSDAGQYVVNVARYTDSRVDEYYAAGMRADD